MKENPGVRWHHKWILPNNWRTSDLQKFTKNVPKSLHVATNYSDTKTKQDITSKENSKGSKKSNPTANTKDNVTLKNDSSEGRMGLPTQKPVSTMQHTEFTEGKRHISACLVETRALRKKIQQKTSSST